MNPRTRSMTLTLAVASYPAVVYWGVYIPLIVPRLASGAGIPTTMKVLLVVPYVAVLAMAAYGATWQQVLRRSGSVTLANLTFQCIASRSGAPSLSHPDLDEPLIWAFRGALMWALLFAYMLIVCKASGRARPSRSG